MNGKPLRITELDVPAFLMNVPLSLSTDEPNNAWMRELEPNERRIDQRKALHQFQGLYSFLAARALVYLLPSREGLQDQTYVANLAVMLPHTTEKTLVVSNFRSAPRRNETDAGIQFFKQMSLPFEVAPPFFEGEADLKYLDENVYVGAHGLRTSYSALRWFERNFDMKVIPFEIQNEYLYHLDCSIFPITRDELLVCTEMAGSETLNALEQHASIIDVSLENADSGATNCVRLGDCLLSASHIEELACTHEDYGYEKAKREFLEKTCAQLNLTPVFFNMSEFLKSGAMLSCMVMHLNHRNF